MKNTHSKSDSEILRQKAEKLLRKKAEAEILELIEELAFQNREKEKRADELLIANKELALQNQEKAKRADELIIANKELAFQNEEKTKRADELIIANKELAFQNQEKAKRADELIIANKELAFQNEEKTKRADELDNANANALKLTHELEVHQIELETINDDLILAKEQTEVAAKKYTELYDFAPTGYFTLSKEGKIIELNLTGAAMLGKEHYNLKNNLFGFFISDDTKPIFNLFVGKAFTSKSKIECEVTISTSENLTMHVHLTGIVAESKDQCLVTMVDITERKRAENAIMESEEQLTRILNDVTDVVWSLSWPDMKVNFISPSVELVFGRTMAEFAENPSLWSTTVHPDDKHISDIALQQLTNEGSAVRECRIIRPDGSIVWINDKSKIIVDQNGKPIRIDGVSRDITERKRAEEALIDSNAYLENLINYANAPIIVWDPQFHITRFNHAFEHLTGRSEADILGQSLEILFPPSLVSQSMSLISKTLTGERWETVEIEILHLDESVRTLLWNSATIFALNGHTPIATIAQGHNITERKQTENRLKESEERFRSLTETATDAIISIDADGRINLFNLVAEHIFGYSANEIIGHSMDVMIPDEYGNRHMEGIHRYLETGRSMISGTTRELKGKRQDGTVFPVELSLSEVKLNGKINFIGIIRDISERKRSEAELEKFTHALQKSNSEKDKFFSIIAHDLRSPFNGFLGLSKLMADELSGLTQEQIQKMAGSMRDSATNLFTLLENLLEWSRMQQGGIIFNPESTRLLSIINESKHPLMDSADKKGVEIKYEIPSILEVFADEYMLASTIRNLASNAVKFTRKGGKVTIAAKPGPGHSVEISVRDTGIGMSPQMVADLFRLDVISNRKGTDNEPSSGLGLLLCKEFIEKHGGKLWVESEEGKGSIFYFALPAAPPPNR